MYTNPDDVNVDLLDELDAAFAPSITAAFAADTPAGTVVAGTITRVEIRQSRDFKTRELAFWPDGKPKREVVVGIATPEGDRAVYIPTHGRAKVALSAAVEAAGAHKVSEVLRPGSSLSVRFEGRKAATTSTGDGYEYREYRYAFTPPANDPFSAPPRPRAA